jgi:hypothetical protein
MNSLFLEFIRWVLNVLDWMFDQFLLLLKFVKICILIKRTIEGY